MKKILGTVAGLALVVSAVAPAVAADRNVGAIRTISGGSSELQHVGDLGVGPDGTVYGSSAYWDAVFAYAPTAGANATWARKIAGPKTLINTPSAVAVDGQGRFWTTANSGTFGIGLFAGSNNGDVSPLKTIGGSNTGLNSDTRAIAVGPNGDVYVAEATTDSVRVFSAQAGGNVEPARVLVGGNTQIVDPSDVAVDGAGNLYVLVPGSAKVLVFSSTANGNATPVRTIAGASTTLVAPAKLAVDSGRNLYVTDVANDSVSVFGPAANGDVKPVTRLVGASTQLVNPGAVALGADRRVYVLDSGGPAVRVYAPLVPFVKPGPVRSLAVSGKKSSQTRKVTWAAPPANLNATAVTAYRVVIKKGSKTLVSKTVAAGTRSLVVKRSKLKAGTLTVKVVAVNKQGDGPIVTKTFKVT